MVNEVRQAAEVHRQVSISEYRSKRIPIQCDMLSFWVAVDHLN